MRYAITWRGGAESARILPSPSSCRHHDQTSFPFSSTYADMPPLTFFDDDFACSAIRVRSSSRLCFANVASRSASASAFAAFSASRFAACCRCFFVSVSGAFCAVAVCCKGVLFASISTQRGYSLKRRNTEMESRMHTYLVARDSSQLPTRHHPPRRRHSQFHASRRQPRSHPTRSPQLAAHLASA